MGATDPRVTDFLVSRSDLRQCRVAEAPRPEPQPGEALLRVDTFALTANNITYAVFGDAMRYWDFFPAPAGWGRIPVWGYATVVRSRHDALPEGERVYGYLPMSTHLVVQPGKVGDASFVDAAPHRAALPGPYQVYTRAAHVPGFGPEFEDVQSILRPLFFTSFLIEDFLADNDLFGATSVVVASASSKTALGVAFQLTRNRPRGCRVIGLTSPRNVEFCRRVRYYDEVLTYDALASLPAGVPTVYVDMAGDGKLLHAVHDHFRDQLKHSCIVGATHWEDRATQHAMPGPKPQFFFAPTQIQKRRKDWEPGVLEQRLGAAWDALVPSVKPWLEVTHGRGAAAVEKTYREVLEGRSRPEQGHMLSLL